MSLLTEDYSTFTVGYLGERTQRTCHSKVYWSRWHNTLDLVHKDKLTVPVMFQYILNPRRLSCDVIHILRDRSRGV